MNEINDEYFSTRGKRLNSLITQKVAGNSFTNFPTIFSNKVVLYKNNNSNNSKSYRSVQFIEIFRKGLNRVFFIELSKEFHAMLID